MINHETLIENGYSFYNESLYESDSFYIKAFGGIDINYYIFMLNYIKESGNKFVCKVDFCDKNKEYETSVILHGFKDNFNLSDLEKEVEELWKNINYCRK